MHDGPICLLQLTITEIARQLYSNPDAAAPGYFLFPPPPPKHTRTRTRTRTHAPCSPFNRAAQWQPPQEYNRYRNIAAAILNLYDQV